MSKGHTPCVCAAVLVDVCLSMDEQGGVPGVQWRHECLSMDLGCSWGATAGVDEAPLRSTKEESEAVRTQPLILVILVSHCTLRYYLTLDCFQV